MPAYQRASFIQECSVGAVSYKVKKERIHIPSNTTDILLDCLSAQARPEDKTTDLSDNTEAKSDVSQ